MKNNVKMICCFLEKALAYSQNVCYNPVRTSELEK